MKSSETLMLRLIVFFLQRLCGLWYLHGFLVIIFLVSILTAFMLKKLHANASPCRNHSIVWNFSDPFAHVFLCVFFLRLISFDGIPKWFIIHPYLEYACSKSMKRWKIGICFSWILSMICLRVKSWGILNKLFSL